MCDLALPGISRFVITGSVVVMAPVLARNVLIARSDQHYSLRSSTFADFDVSTLGTFCVV